METKEDIKEDIVDEIIKLTSEHIKLVKKAKRSIETIRPCYRCGYCCQNKEILVTIPEVVLILNKLDYKVENIFNINKEIYTISIKTKEIEGKPYCRFLWKTEFKTRCTIYNIRPFQCLTYPIIFHPLFKKLEVYKGKFLSYYIFECQGKAIKTCILLVKKSTFKKLAEERLKFLRKNYEIQRALIKDDILEDVLMMVVKNIRALDMDLELDLNL